MKKIINFIALVVVVMLFGSCATKYEKLLEGNRKYDTRHSIGIGPLTDLEEINYLNGSAVKVSQ